MTEPWMRGALPGLDPVISHLLRASQHIREDLRNALVDLSSDEIWLRPRNLTSAGFHAKHLAGSTQRLCAYLAGRGLTDEEIAAIAQESFGDEDSAALIRRVDDAFDACDALVQSLRTEDYAAIRHIGRARIPVTAISLAIHIAEHGQRHIGQAIAAAKLARALRNG